MKDPPYLSEPYSEQTADEDEVKKLINFGDDYRAVLGSYSDASSISLKVPLKSHKTRSKSSWHKVRAYEKKLPIYIVDCINIMCMSVTNIPPLHCIICLIFKFIFKTKHNMKL